MLAVLLASRRERGAVDLPRALAQCDTWSEALATLTERIESGRKALWHVP